MNRVFLGWEGRLLSQAVTHLVARFAADFDGVILALPGARAGRILAELLAREVGSQLRPPQITTAGGLSDQLLELSGAPAGRLVRTLAWEAALRRLPAEDLRWIVARPPAAEDQLAWGALAEEVRGLFGEVAAEGLDFAAVAASRLLEELDGQSQRWLALGKAQVQMVEELEAAGLRDPHLGRLAAIEAGRARRPREVVLIGVVEMNELLRRALQLCEAPQTALVFAPDDVAERFDSFGCLQTAAWTGWQSSMSIDQWQVVERPEDQAQAVVRAIAAFGGRYRAEEISVGLGSAEVSPFLKRQLAESGVLARDAAGVSMASTAALRLLVAVSGFLRTRSFAQFSALLRHPDFEAAILVVDAELRSRDGADILDHYQVAHLPWRVDGLWLADQTERRDVELRGRTAAVWSAARQVLGDLLEAGPGSVRQQAVALRAFLGSVYAGRELDAAVEADRLLIASLRCLANALTELQDLPASLAPEGSIAAAIDLLVRVAANRANDVAPGGARADEPTIEMMGWLELALDDAPALLVTGFEDGKIPESVRGDAYLPNRLRRDLGIVDNEKRLARDLYATEVLVHSRQDVVFITGRRSGAGDPLLPSRVVFHCPAPEVPERVRKFLSGRAAEVARVAAPTGKEYQLPRCTGSPPPLEVISVSAFKSYLESPYAYYLEHVLKLRTLNDAAREMDGAAFGNLAHTVLQRFGADEQVREQQDPEAIADYLLDQLHGLGEDIYGRQPLPAVRLQLAQLALRLRSFAGLQANRRAAGWRIREVEWAPEGGTVDFVVDDQVVRIGGRIDRIDYHEGRGSWAVWDYKTGDSFQKPVAAHRRQNGAWRDLQLPLYCLLVADLLEGEQPEELGYIGIGRDEKSTGFFHEKDWRRPKAECDDSIEALSKGLDEAAEVVRGIRRGELFDLNAWQPYDEIFAAIGGVGLIGLAQATADADGEEVGA